MNPIKYYTWMRKHHSYRPPHAALATLAVYCTKEDYWRRAQRMSDWLSKRSRHESAVLAHEDDRYTYTYTEPVYSDSICSDCTSLRWVNPDEFLAQCEDARFGVEWPGRANEDGDIVACPYFRPIGDVEL